MSQEPFDALAKVVDEASFIEFLASLAADREDEVAKECESPSSPYEAGANGWENGTIEAFLDAAAAWGAESAKNPLGLPKPTNPWRRCADIIYAGKIYE